MNILMCAINPLFADKVIGGSTKHLRNVAEHLGSLGHRVTILCSKREQNTTEMRWGANVLVKPCFDFKQPFPGPYEIPAYQFAANIQRVVDHLQDADRLYMHDGEFLFPSLCLDIPSVVSLRDCVYPETMLGSFLFQADELITLNRYCRDSVLATTGRYLENLPERVKIIHNGFDWDFFKPTEPSAELRRIIGFDPEPFRIVLHPHRPEPTKGLPQTIETVDHMVNRHGFHNLRVLIPKWFDSDETESVVTFMKAQTDEINQRGLSHIFIFHDWLPQRLMPEYYSLGDLTLVLGSFVEAFGNATYESLGCGTPVIASRVSSNRELLPDHLLDKVHFGDNTTAARLAAQILIEGAGTKIEVMDYLRTHYSQANQVDAYADTILNARKRPPIRYKFQPLNDLTRFTFAPWCYLNGDSIYHDYMTIHRPNPGLAEIWRSFPTGFSAQQAATHGVDQETLATWYANGLICPTNRDGSDDSSNEPQASGLRNLGNMLDPCDLPR